MLVNNISNLLLDSELFIDDKFLDSYEEGLKNKLKLGAAGAAIAGGVGNAGNELRKGLSRNKLSSRHRNLSDEVTAGPVRVKAAADDYSRMTKPGTSDYRIPEHHERVLAKSKLDNEIANHAKSVKELEKFKGDNAASSYDSSPKDAEITGGMVGGIAIAGVAGAYLVYKFFKSLTYANWKIKNLETKVKSKPELKNKLQLWYAKRDKIKSQLQTENKNFIEKTKLIKAKIAELERSKSDKESIAKLKIQLDKRMKFIQKIGAKV